MAVQYTKKEYELAKSVSCLEYLSARGYTLQKHGKGHKLKDHNSLIIFPDGKFTWFSKGISGNAITLLTELEGMKLNEAVKELAQFSNGTINRNETTFQDGNKEIKSQKTKEKFILPKRNNSTKKVMEYLIDKRQLDKQVVEYAINNNLIYQDKKGNCIFVGYDENKEPKFATLRGTYDKPFRQDILGSDKSFGFSSVNKQNDVLYVFESAIDSLSMMTLSKSFNYNYLSLNGVSLNPLDIFLKNNPNIKTIVTCLDNDDAGIKATKNIWAKYKSDYSLKYYNMLAKDVNEQLILEKSEVKIVIVESNLNSLISGEIVSVNKAEEILNDTTKNYNVNIKIVQGNFELSEQITVENKNNSTGAFSKAINKYLLKAISTIESKQSNLKNVSNGDKSKLKKELNVLKSKLVLLSKFYYEYKDKVKEKNKIRGKVGDIQINKNSATKNVAKSQVKER